MFELMAENELKKKHCKLLNDMFMRKLELQKLRKEMNLLPKNIWDLSAIELRGLAGQPKNIQAAKVTRGESTSQKEDLWHWDRRYESFTGGVDDEVWEHLMMTGGIPDLPESPQLRPIGCKWTTNNAENIGLQTECNNEEIVRGLMELCNLTNTGFSGEVQSVASARTIARGNQFHVQSSSSQDETTLQDKTFNVDLFKTEICSSWNNTGECIYGKNCRFAHGTNELRERPKPHRNYKTAMCKNFLAGFCPYGSRCCFIHNLKEKHRAIGEGHIVVNDLLKTMVKQDTAMIQRWKR